MKNLKTILFVLTFLFSSSGINAEDGYRLWLRYDLISDTTLLNEYNKYVTGWMIEGKSPTLEKAGNELQMGLNGLLGREIPEVTAIKKSRVIIAGTSGNSDFIASLCLNDRLNRINDEGFIIISSTFKKKKIIVIAAKFDAGVLYGTFHFLRQLQTHQKITGLAIESSPITKLRLLNHWDKGLPYCPV
jgi:alpha-glucuronidase